MHSIWFGEFMGTLVLILFGNGVNAAVTLRKSYAADSGWMVITTGWALGVLCGVVVAQAFGSGAANLNPAITLASAVITGNYAQLPVYWSAQLLGAMGGAALVDSPLRAALAPHARSRGQARRLLHQRGSTQPSGKHLQRDVGHGSARRNRGCHLFPRRRHERPSCGTGSVACRKFGVGHRPLARRHHRLCHQPRARSWAPHRSCAAADPRQGRIELALRVDSHRWRFCGRGARWSAVALRSSVDSDGNDSCLFFHNELQITTLGSA